MDTFKMEELKHQSRKIHDFMHKCTTEEICFLFIAIGIIFVEVLAMGNNPGLYLDAINPDYAAIHWFNNNLDNPKWFVAYPFLCQIYHGTIGMLITAISFLITGSTSVFQHHMCNGIMIFICFLLLKLFAKKLSMENKMVNAILLVLLISPCLAGFIFSQHYIELPGTIMLLISLNLMGNGKNKDDFSWKKFLQFYLLGLAFYSYFNFLFFSPLFFGIFLWHEIRCKAYRELMRKFIFASSAFILGSVLYIVGYSKIYFTECFSGLTTTYLLIAETMVIIILSFLSIYNTRNNNNLFFVSYVVLLLSIFMIIYMVFPSVRNIAVNLNIYGRNVTFIERFQLLKQYLCDLIGCFYIQSIVAGKEIFVLGLTYIYIFAATVIVGLYIVFVKSRVLWSDLTKFFVFFCVYLILCFPLISRMQIQHFVPLFFFSVILLLLALDRIIYCFYKKKLVYATFVGIIIFLAVINGCNTYRLINNINISGGLHYYSNQINKLAEDALEELNQRKVVYFFPEWGLIFGFNYLTKNMIKCECDVNKIALEKYLNQGNDIRISFWDSSKESEYRKYIYMCGYEVLKKIYYQNDGKSAFFVLSNGCRRKSNEK